MSSNGKTVVSAEVAEQERDIIAQTRDILKDWTLMAEPNPVTAQEKLKYKRSGRNWKLYQSIDWPVWWDEFNSKLIPKGQPGAGHRMYRSAWHLICKKTKVHWQRQALWDMIGPEPKLQPDEILPAPYLGNWDVRRKNNFYVFEDPTKALMVEQAIKERHDSLEASKALMPMIARRLAYWYQIRDKVTAAFGGEPLSLDQPVTHEDQLKRGDRFFKWMMKTEEIIETLERQWMIVTGTNPNAPGQELANMAMAGKVGAAAALTGAVAAGGIPGRPMLVQDGQELPIPEGVTYDSILFAQMLKGNEETYNLPLPLQKAKATHVKVKTQ